MTNGLNPCLSSSSSSSSVAAEESDEEIDDFHLISRLGALGTKPTAYRLVPVKTFTFQELATATKNFRPDNILSEEGSRLVYSGLLESTGQVTAVKKLVDLGGKGNREFLVEVITLRRLHHSNITKLIGYCVDVDQRLLVFEFTSLGSLKDHLHDLPPNKKPLDWNTRMKIAAGAAKALEYLHDKAYPPVIHRNIKPSSILLDDGYNSKLSHFGFARMAPVETEVSTRVMGTYGYCDPEYAMTGRLTTKFDVYSFGVVLLELITGRKAVDNSRPQGERNLVAWARTLFKDHKMFPMMADPLLQHRYPTRGLYKVIAIAVMCTQERAANRPPIKDVADSLSYLSSETNKPSAA